MPWMAMPSGVMLQEIYRVTDGALVHLDSANERGGAGGHYFTTWIHNGTNAWCLCTIM